MKSADTRPALPVDVDVKIYGKKFCPSNNAVDAFPNTDESSDPDTISMRSFSMMLLLVWVSCRGTNASCEMSLFPWSPAPSHKGLETESRQNLDSTYL